MMTIAKMSRRAAEQVIPTAYSAQTVSALVSLEKLSDRRGRVNTHHPRLLWVMLFARMWLCFYVTTEHPRPESIYYILIVQHANGITH